MWEYHLLRELPVAESFAWRGTFSRDYGQGERAGFACFLSKLLVVAGFPFCFPVELFLCFAQGLRCFPCGFWGCFSFIFFPAWDFFWGSACTPNGGINRQVLQLFIAAEQLTWNV